MKGKKYILFNTAMTIVCFLFIVCASTFLILLIKPLYGICAGALDVPSSANKMLDLYVENHSPITLDVCKENYSVLIDYNMFWGPKDLVFPDFFMSEHGTIHFWEVKRIFVTMQVTAIVTAILMIPGILFTRQKKTYGWLLGTVILAVIAVGVVGGGLMFDWDRTFVTMHHILFSNDYWLFDPRYDPVISILPDEVFLAAGAGIVLLIFIGLVTCATVYFKNRKGRNKQAKRGRKK